MLRYIEFIDYVISGVAILTALIYAPFAKTWLKALLIVGAIAVASSSVAVYEVMAAANGKQNILAILTFPITLLIVAIVIRSIRLIIFPIKKSTGAIP